MWAAEIEVGELIRIFVLGKKDGPTQFGTPKHCRSNKQIQDQYCAEAAQRDYSLLIMETSLAPSPMERVTAFLYRLTSSTTRAFCSGVTRQHITAARQMTVVFGYYDMNIQPSSNKDGDDK